MIAPSAMALSDESERILSEVFPPEYVDSLRRRQGDHARRLLDILTSGLPLPSDDEKRWHAQFRVAERSELAACLSAAKRCGLLDGDLLGRLRDRHSSQHRSALAEARACRFFNEARGLSLQPRPQGRGGKVLDFGATLTSQNILVEVKAPYVPVPESGSWSGDDAGVLQECLEEANTQFAEERANVLVIVPSLRTPLYAHRLQLVKAFIGRPVMNLTIDVSTGQAIGDVSPGFVRSGRFVALYPDGAGEPRRRFTRVSAVLTIEPWRQLDDHAVRVDYDVLVVHNPFGQVRLEPGFFGDVPELVPKGSHMEWTDRVA